MIWLLRAPATLTEAELARYLPLLDAKRLDRTRRFRFERNRVEAILAGLLLRCAYAAECGGAVPEIVSDPRGKPGFADPAAPQFNLSHCGSAVCCALSRFPVGVDVQALTPYHEKFRRILSESERSWVEEADRDARFTALWTRKEAYGKALGVGIGYEMEQTAFAGAFSEPTGVGEWLLWTAERTEQFLSCCAKEGLDLRELETEELISRLEEL